MNCNFYVHNGPVGTIKYISGTTCSGSATATTLTYGQQICMDNDKPIINLNNLLLSGSCLAVTPTPTPTASVLCYYSGRTYETAEFQCPNDGLIYEDLYGKLTFRVSGGAYPGDHPDYSIVVSNGIQFETILLPRGQEFIEYVYLQTDFRYDGQSCFENLLVDWYFFSVPNIPDCQACELEGNATYYVPVTTTPTPTPTSTPNVTPTQITRSYSYYLSRGLRAGVCSEFTSCGIFYLNSDTALTSNGFYCTDLNKTYVCRGKTGFDSVSIIGQVSTNLSYPKPLDLVYRNNCGDCPN